MTTPNTQSLPDDRLLFLEFPLDPPGDSRNPYPEYRQLRQSQAVQLAHGRFGDDGPAVAFVLRHADVTAVLRDNETFSSRIFHDFMAPFMGDYVLIGMDEPTHRRYRQLLNPAFSPLLMNKWEDTLIKSVCNGLIDQFAERGEAELVKDFNFNFPTQVISEIIGVPREDFLQFQRWAIDIFCGTIDPAAGIAAAQALREYYVPFVESRHAQPRDDLISELLAAQVDGDHLNDEELYSFLRLLLPAGIETTYRSLGSLLFNLLTRPDQLAAVRRDRSFIAAAIEENLRFDPPVQTVMRIAVRDCEIGGSAIASGTIVIGMVSAANHDPEFVDDPDTFDITRPNIRHVTFGNGVHTCLGLHLARRELRIALSHLLDRLPNLRFDWDKAKEMDAHIRGKNFRSPTALPVLWDT